MTYLLSETTTDHEICPTCEGKGGWLDGDMGVATHWKVCPDCGPRTGRDLQAIIDDLREWYAEPGINLPYRKVRKLVDALQYVNARIA